SRSKLRAISRGHWRSLGSQARRSTRTYLFQILRVEPGAARDWLRPVHPMTATAPSLSTEEQEQLQQTIEMFEVIVQASPQDCQSLEILKDAYNRLGRAGEAMASARRLADTYRDLG